MKVRRLHSEAETSPLAQGGELFLDLSGGATKEGLVGALFALGVRPERLHQSLGHADLPLGFRAVQQAEGAGTTALLIDSAGQPFPVESRPASPRSAQPRHQVRSEPRARTPHPHPAQERKSQEAPSLLPIPSAGGDRDEMDAPSGIGPAERPRTAPAERRQLVLNWRRGDAVRPAEVDLYLRTVELSPVSRSLIRRAWRRLLESGALGPGPTLEGPVVLATLGWLVGTTAAVESLNPQTVRSTALGIDPGGWGEERPALWASLAGLALTHRPGAQVDPIGAALVFSLVHRHATGWSGRLWTQGVGVHPGGGALVALRLTGVDAQSAGQPLTAFLQTPHVESHLLRELRRLGVCHLRVRPVTDPAHGQAGCEICGTVTPDTHQAEVYTLLGEAGVEVADLAGTTWLTTERHVAAVEVGRGQKSCRVQVETRRFDGRAVSAVCDPGDLALAGRTLNRALADVRAEALAAFWADAAQGGEIPRADGPHGPAGAARVQDERE